MKFKELLKWAIENDCLDCEVCVQYRDDGGVYHRKDYDIHPTLEDVTYVKGWSALNKKVIVL